MIEDGADHRPDPRGQPHRQRPGGAEEHRRRGQRLRHGRPGHVRQGRPGRAGRRRQPDAAGDGDDGGRHGRVPDSRELLDLATRIAGWAAGDEQVEAYVMRGRETDIRVHEGEDRAALDGRQRGRRHPRRRRPSPGLRLGRVAGCRGAGGGARRGPGQRLRSARPTSSPAWPRPTGWRRRTSTRTTRRSPPSRPDQKIDLALDLERRTREGDARIRAVEAADYGDGLSGVGRGHQHGHRGVEPGHRRLPVHVGDGRRG